MAADMIVVFRQYPFKAGQKIQIQSGPRSGDWEVVQVSERKVKLRCPVSRREFEWDRFCYFVEEREGGNGPKRSRTR